MKKIFFIAAVAATALAACSNDKTVAISGETGNEVGFRTVTDKGTRAAVTDATNMLSFTVTGWWDEDDSNSYGDTDKGSYLFNAKDITRGEAGGTAWDYSPKRYWPSSGTVDFFAYSPASSNNVTTGLKDLAATAPEIAYDVPKVGENNPQEDFLVATFLDASSGTVALNFQHALSRVKFEATKNVDDVEYIIDGIELVNLSSSAKLDLTALNASDASVFPATGGFTYASADPWDRLVMWTDHNAADVDYAVDFSASPVYVKETYTSVIGVTNGLMIMPQPTELGAIYTKANIGDVKGAGPDLVTAADVMTPQDGEEDCFYIKVSYKAFQGTGDDIFYYAGNATSSKEMFIPVKDQNDPAKGLTFEIGRQYTFRVTFGDSNGSSGGDLGDVIAFSVDVAEWDDVDPIEVL